MFLPNIRALAVVCWIMCVRITVSKGVAGAPAPTLKFKKGVIPSYIVLNTYVPFSCDAPSGAPYPVQVFVGKLENSSQIPETTEAWWTSNSINYPKSVDFDVPALAKYEGKVVCWYQSTRTEQKNSYSEFSNPVTLAISGLRSPTVSLQPSVFVVGGNYTVFCNSTAGPFTNFTLSLLYRIMPVTPGTNWTLLGSVFLTNGISIFSEQTNAVIPIEFACTMEMLYNGKVLHSPQSYTERAIPEELPVRLWEKNRGESCLGFLDVKLRGNWEPVCHQEDDTVADASAAFATAEVVCRELGCGNVLESRRILENTRYFSNIFGGFRCSGKEEKIRDCPLNKIEFCKQRESLYIICSDSLPPPKLSVETYGPIPKLYVTDKQNVELSCSFVSTHVKKDYVSFVFRKDGVTLKEIYTRVDYSASITLSATVHEGRYECACKLSDAPVKRVSQPSNTVFIYIYNPPNPGPIVAGVLTTIIGVAILTYICVYRTPKKEVQSNEFPAHPQDPATNTENPDKNVYIPQQL